MLKKRQKKTGLLFIAPGGEHVSRGIAATDQDVISLVNISIPSNFYDGWENRVFIIRPRIANFGCAVFAVGC